MITIQIQNFQSIHDASIIVNGFTVVTGSNNSGKTAAMRAIQATFSNPPVSAFVRHGTDKLNVKVAFADGRSLAWEKGHKVKPSYTIDGNAPIHPGREIPPEVQGFGIQPIQAGGSTVWPQIAPQFTGTVFLLDMSGSAIAEAVTDVARVGKLNNALKLAESDRRSASSELKIRQKDLSQAEKVVAQFEGLDQVQIQFAAIEQQYIQLQKAQAILASLVRLRDSLRSVGKQIQNLLWVDTVVLPIEPVELRQSIHRLSQLAQLQKLHAQHRLACSNLSWTQNIHIPPMPTIPLSTLQELQRIQSARNVLQTQIAKHSAVPSLPAAFSTDRLSKAIQYHQDLSPLLKRIQATQDEIESLESRCSVSERDLQQCRDEVAWLVAEMGTCSLCGRAGHAAC